MTQQAMQTLPSAGSALAELVLIDDNAVAHLWPRVRGFIERAYETGGDDSFEQTEAKVLSGRALLWVVFNGGILGAVVTQILHESRNRVCLILACGGNELALWQSQISVIEDYARSQDCTCVRMSGRKGWKRIFRDYEEPWITLEKRL